MYLEDRHASNRDGKKVYLSSSSSWLRFFLLQKYSNLSLSNVVVGVSVGVGVGGPFPIL